MSPPEPGPRRFADRFSLLGELGRGGMATVHLARDDASGRTVALKVLHPHLAGDGSARRRLARELAATREVRHPAVLPVHEAIEAEGTVALVMPACADGPLLEAVERDGVLDEARLRRLLEEVGGALAEAHRVGVLHRDVSPGNVLLDGDRFRLADFGVARVAAGHTATTSALGTPGYAPPEAWDGAGWDPRADAWSLGAVLWFAATGGPPFGGATALEAVERQLRGERPALATLRPDLPPDLVARVEALLEPDVGARASVSDALGAAPLARPEAARPGPRWQLTQVGAAVSVALLAGVGWFQDLGGFLLSIVLDGHAIPKPDVFEMSQGVAALLLLPLALVPAVLGGFAGRHDPERRLAPWLGIVALAVVDLLYSLLAGVVLPQLNMRGTADLFGTMLFHQGLFLPILAAVVLTTRPWTALRAPEAAAPRLVEDAGLASRARGALDRLAATLADAPDVVRVDLSEPLAALREEVAALGEEAARLDEERAALDADPAALARLEARLRRARALSDDGADALAEALTAREAAVARAEAVDARRTAIAARLLAVRAGVGEAAERVRADPERPFPLARLAAGAG